MKRSFLMLAVLLSSFSILPGCGPAAPTAEEQKKVEAEAKTNMNQGMEAMKGAMKQIDAAKGTGK